MSEQPTPRQRPDLSVLRRDPEEFAPRRSGPPWGTIITLVVLAAIAWGVYTYVPLRFLWPEVETATARQVTPTQKSTVLTATGYTYARIRAAVGAKIIGRILELPIDEGDTLKKGQLIAVLDSDNLNAELRQAEAAVLESRAQLADAQREKARQDRLVRGRGAGPVRARRGRHPGRRGARPDQATARRGSPRPGPSWPTRRIYSPIDGVVIEKNVEVGEMVAPGGFTSQQSTGAIARLADPRSLEVEADINESYIARLRRGQPVAITVDAVPDHRLPRLAAPDRADRRPPARGGAGQGDDRRPRRAAGARHEQHRHLPRRRHPGRRPAERQADQLHRRRRGRRRGRRHLRVGDRKRDPAPPRSEAGRRSKAPTGCSLGGLSAGELVALPGPKPFKEGMKVRVKS